MVALLGLIAPADLRAQTEPSKSATAASPTPAAPVPLGRYVPKEHLIVYAEFGGSGRSRGVVAENGQLQDAQ